MYNLGLIFLRVIPPISNNIYHMYNHQKRQPYNVEEMHKMYQFPGISQKNQLIPLPQYEKIQPEFKVSTQTTRTDEESQILDLNQQQNLLSSIPSGLERNCIKQRIKILQYEANNPCEDRMVVGQLNLLDAYTVSIFDGHGGPQLAQYSKEKINNFIDCYLKDNASKNKGKNIGDVLKEALDWSYHQIQDTFYEVYQQHIKVGNKKIKNVGTCAITAIVYNDKVYLGNSGDSQGIFILSDSKSSIRTQKMNERLNTNNKIERQRIIQQWKDLDSEIIVQDSNNSYYLKGRLQPTRTIGDYYLKKQNHYNGQGIFKGPYLKCDPDFTEYKLTKDHKYLVIASDGVWDVLSRNEVMTYLIKQKEFDVNKTMYEQQELPYVSNIVSKILEKSSEVTGKPLDELKRMEKGKRRNYHDDISIAVVTLQNQV